MRRLLVVLIVLASAVTPAAQSDLDALMSRVLARRDENWKKLQQYVVEERESLQLLGPAGRPIYGARRDYLWFPRDGRFIRSPVSADGVAIGAEERRREEERWLRREERRERALEPGFVSAAYFLNFTFDPGQYALVGRERFEDRDVLRIEYYPTKMFTEGRTRPNRELRERDQDVERKMNKVSLVTLWIDAADNQIVRYELANVDMDFMPAQQLARIDGMTATMEMGRPFPGVWLPRSVRIAFEMSLAIGQVEGTYSSEYHDYRLASVEVTVRPNASASDPPP